MKKNVKKVLTKPSTLNNKKNVETLAISRVKPCGATSIGRES